MRSFNDWYFDLFESGNGACLNQQEIAQEAWDYRQTEVDELQKQRDSFIKAYEIEMNESVELQKIINASNKVLESMRKELEHGHLSDDQYKTLSSYTDDLEQAIKV